MKTYLVMERLFWNEIELDQLFTVIFALSLGTFLYTLNFFFLHFQNFQPVTASEPVIRRVCRIDEDADGNQIFIDENGEVVCIKNIFYLTCFFS